MTPPLDDASTSIPAIAPPSPEQVLDRAVDAALSLAADRPWRDIALRDIAQVAGVPVAALYARAPGKAALMSRLAARQDSAALAVIEGDPSAAPHDRLFEAFMARIETLEPNRDALIAIVRAEGAVLARLLPRTTRALAEGAGVDTSGARGALRLAALTAVWARTLQVWRDDEGALNRTMAEIDKRLKEADRRLSRLRAGWSD
ncbi:TetR family transcriptional regulator [soil metagenome]